MATPTIYRTTTALSLDTPKGLAIDTHLGQILISDSGNTRVITCRLDWMSSLNTLSTYDGNTIGPAGACYYNGYYYICDNTNHTLVRLRAKDLSYKDHFGTAGASGNTSSTLSTPTGVTSDKQYLYIVDYGNDRIVKLNLETLAYDSETSNINGALSLPYSITYKKEGGEALFIGAAGRIIKCKTDFTYIEQNASDTSLPLFMAFKDDYLHVVNGNSTIVVLSSDGLTSITSYTDNTLDGGHGIAIYRDAMFISDDENDRISIWKTYNPRDAFTSATPAKFGGRFFDQPMIIVDVDTVTVGATQESGSPNRWKEENINNYGIGWTEEDEVSSAWTEES
jgi:hypothetical protein